MFVDRLAERARIVGEEKGEVHISSFEVTQKITEEVVRENSDLVNAITLKEVPRSALEMGIRKIINRYNYKVIGKTRKDLIEDVFSNIFGYGDAQKYLNREDLNGLFVNRPGNVWIKVGSEMQRIHDIAFKDNKDITLFIKSIAAKLGGEINDNKTISKFEDHENKLRIVATLSPTAHISPCVVFRKHRDEAFTLDDLVEVGMLTKELAEDLRMYIRAGANIAFAGKGGAGKTTIARALLEEAIETERMLVMEEHAEFFLKHPGAIQKLVKRSERGHILGLAELTDYGLLESIDKYVFGEIRGSEAMYLFNGAFAGNQTIFTTHAKSARHVPKKLMINMKMSGTDINDNTLLDMIYDSMNIIVYMESFTVTEVVEIVSEAEEKFNDLWKFEIEQREATFIQGKHVKVGNIKSEEMIGKLRAKNIIVKEEIPCGA